jgi:hypothetical protein
MQSDTNILISKILHDFDHSFDATECVMEAGDLSKTIYGLALLAQFEHNPDKAWVMEEVHALFCLDSDDDPSIGPEQQEALDAFEKLVIMKGHSLNDGSLDLSSKDNQYPA